MGWGRDPWLLEFAGVGLVGSNRGQTVGAIEPLRQPIVEHVKDKAASRNSQMVLPTRTSSGCSWSTLVIWPEYVLGFDALLHISPGPAWLCQKVDEMKLDMANGHFIECDESDPMARARV